MFESLEQRLHLAAVMWDGGAGTDSWHDALNWDNDAVPTGADDVTIPETALTEVRIFASDAVARSITSDEQMRVSGGASLTLSQSAVLDADLYLGDGVSNAFLVFASGIAQSLSGSGAVIFHDNPSSFVQHMVVGNGVTLTVEPGFRIEGGNGAIHATAAGATLRNEGTIAASLPGRVLTLQGMIDNTAGLIEVGSANRLHVNGDLNGGIIHGAAGSRLSGGTLRAATMTGSLAINGDQVVQVADGLTVDGILTIGNGVSNAFLDFVGTGASSLDGVGSIVFHDNPSGYHQRLTLSAGVILTAEAEFIIRGGRGAIYASAPGALLVNEGTIAADIAGRVLTVLGSLDNSNGVIEIVDDAELTVSGQVVGGVLQGEEGARISGGAFSGVTLTGQLLSLSNAWFEGGLTVDGTLIIGNGTTTADISFQLTPQQTLSGAGSVVFAQNTSGYNQRLFVQGGVTLTIAPGFVVRGGTGQIQVVTANSTLVNQGLIQADVAANTLSFNGGGTVINESLITADDGASLATSALIENDLGTIQIGDMSSLSAGFTVEGGVIHGMAGATLGAGLLRGVSLTGSLTIQDGNTVSIEDGLTVNGTLTIGNGLSNAHLSFQLTPAQTLGGTGQVVFADNPSGYLQRIVANGGSMVTIDAALVIRGGDGVIEATAAGAAVINEGTISADAAGRILYLAGHVENFDGLIEVSAGSTLIVASGMVAGGVIHGEAGSRLASQSGGALSGVTLTGALSVVGATLDIQQGVTVNGTLTVGMPELLSQSYLTFSATGSQTLGGTGEIILIDTNGSHYAHLIVNADVSLTIAPDFMVRGGGALIANAANAVLVNAGLIQADAAERTLSVHGQISNVNGLIEVGPTTTFTIVAGTLSGGAIHGEAGSRLSSQNGGALSGVTMTGALSIVGATLDIQQSLTVNGTLTVGMPLLLSQTYLTFSATASQVLGGTGEIILIDSNGSHYAHLIVNSEVTLNIGPDVTVRGAGALVAIAANSMLVNAGVIRADGADRTLSLHGQISNANGLIEVGPTTTLNIVAGTLSGGVIHGQAGSRLSSQSGGAMSGVTMTGALSIVGAMLDIQQGLTINGTLSLGEGSTPFGRLRFDTTANQLLGGTGAVVFDRTVDDPQGAIELGAGVTLTIGADMTIRGGNGYLLATVAGSSIVNLGAIIADEPGRYISLFSQGGGGIFNQGIVQAIDGGLLWFYGNFTNSAGVVDIRDGGVAIVSQSEIIGGTITGTGGGLIYNNAGNGSLRGVTVNGHIRVPAGTQIATLNGLTVNGSFTVTGQLLFNGGGVQTLGGTGEVIFDTAAGVKLVRVNAGSLVVGPDITIRGGEGSINSAGTSSQVVINGTIFADTASATITLSGVAAFVIAGHLQAAADATVSLSTAMTHQPGSTYTGAGTIRFDSGTHTFAAGSFTIASTANVAAMLTGDGNLTFTGTVTWAAFATGAGTLTFAPTATVTHLGGGYHRNTNNYGILNWTNGDFELFGGRTFTNHVGGQFEFAVPASRPHSYMYLNSGVATFINEGTFIKSGGSSISGPSQLGELDFFNRGTISHNLGFSSWGRVRMFLNEADGVLAVNGGSMHLLNASNPGTIAVAAGAQLSLPQLPPQVVGDSLVGGTWIVGGTLNFPGGTSLLSLEAGASFTLDGPSTNVGGSLAGLTTNNGLLTIRDPGVFPFNPAGGEFFNNGTLALTGTGTFSIPPSITFNNGPTGAGGVVRVGDNLRGPGPIIIDNPIDGGTLDIFGTVTINQDFDIFAVINLHPGGTLNGIGHITARAAFNWFGGTQSGSGSTTAAAQLTLHGTDVMTLSRVASNTFAGNWTGGCLLLAGGQFVNSTGAAFVVTGTVEVLSDEVGGEQFVNEGSLVFEQGSESTFGDNLAVTSTPGSETVYRAQVSYTDDHTFDGNIAVELTGVLTASGNLMFLAGFDLRLGGEITGAGTITFGGLFRWINGSMTGTGTTVIEEEAIFELSGGDKLLARTLENHSVAGNWTGGCIFMMGGIFNNRETASLDIFADPQIDVVDGGGVNEFNNDGLITVHTGEFVIGVPGTNNGTIIVIPPDTLVFAAAWFHMPGSSLEGPGGVRFEAGQHTIPAGGLNITGPITITSGALVLAAMFMPNYNAATFTFTGGHWSVSGEGQLFLNGAEIRIIGVDTTFEIGGTGVIGALDTLARVDGTLSLADGAVFTSNPNGADGVFINNGLVTVGTGATFAPEFYQQTASGILQTRLTGLGASERGYVSITGNALLAGVLRIEHVEGFDVAMGQQITFFSAAAADGWFEDISVGAAGAGLHVVLGEFEGQILFTITHAGDWNLDFVRDVQDIFDFLTDWFSGEGDYNGDGTHQIADIFAFLTAWFTV